MNYKSSNYSKTVSGYKNELCKNQTPSEKRFKRWLDRYSVKYQFQKIVTVESGKKYIVDFYIPKENVIIEVDGSSHIGKEIEDGIRTNEIERLGYVVIRITNEETKKKINNISEIINQRYYNQTGKIIDIFKVGNVKEETKDFKELKKIRYKVAKLKEQISKYKREIKRLNEENTKLRSWIDDSIIIQ